jgi:hypothetical protein
MILFCLSPDLLEKKDRRAPVLLKTLEIIDELRRFY